MGMTAQQTFTIMAAVTIVKGPPRLVRPRTTVLQRDIAFVAATVRHAQTRVTGQGQTKVTITQAAAASRQLAVLGLRTGVRSSRMNLETAHQSIRQ